MSQPHGEAQVIQVCFGVNSAGGAGQDARLLGNG